MRIAAVLASLACLSCGSGSGSRTCSDAFGQDCGEEITVTLEYISIRPLDAGATIGSRDAGTIGTGAGTAACDYCVVTRTMPLAQFEFAVKPHTGCAPRWTDTTTAVMDCAGATCGSGTGVPQGAEAGACVWAPPLLPP